MCSIWHLAAVSVVRCSVIVRPLTHYTIFTDRVLRAIISTMWATNLVVAGAINVGVTEAYFSWVDMVALVNRQNNAPFASVFAALNVIVATLIILIAYIKVFLAVRRQVRSMSTAVPGAFSSNTIFGSSVRSAKNLFVMCAAYYLAYLPVTFRMLLRARGVNLPETVEFAMTWIYISLAALNGILYISLHSTVRRELRRYLPCCRRPTVAAAWTQPVGDAGNQRNVGSANPGAATPGAPIVAMTSSSHQPVTVK